MTFTDFLKKWSAKVPLSERHSFVQDASRMMEPPETTMFVESTISSQDTRPIVTIRYGSYVFQVSPDEARKIGRDFYEVAGGAEADAFLFQKLTEMGMEANNVFVLINKLRDWRGSRMNQPAASPKKQ
jgi:hypothetical protein